MTLTYPSNLAGLRARVYQRLLTTATAGHHWDDADVQRALNAAQHDVQQELLLSFEDWFYDSVPGLVPSSNKIDIPAGTIRVTQLDRLVTSGEYCPVTLIDPSQYHEFQYRTLPQQIWGTVVYDDEAWIRFPTYLEAVGSTARDGTYRMVRQKSVTDLEDDAQETEIPPQFTEMLVNRAAQTLAEDAGDPKASVLEKRYQEGMNNMRRQAMNMTQTKVRTIRRRTGWRR